MHLEDTGNKLKISTEAFIICDNQILLFQRSADSKIFPGYWTIPGGHINSGEDALSACIRETQEETGLLIYPNNIKLKYLAIHTHLDRKETWQIFGFLVSIQNKHDVVNSKEGVAKWTPLNQVKDLDLFPPVAYYLEHAINTNSGILFSASNWENAKLVKLIKETRTS